MQSVFTGPVYVVRDNIDTDQIIPAQFLTLVPTIPGGVREAGQLRALGIARFPLPDPLYVAEGAVGLRLSRSWWPAGISAAAVPANTPPSPWAPPAAASCLAESFARIFFRNCIATGELYPVECVERLCDVFKTGDVATVDIDTNTIRHHGTGRTYALRAMGEVRPVIDSGGIFEYARKNGMMPKAA
jgi:3-isopropylmalate/(R)-2-methylmalate dehydratase small subunit